MGEPSSYCHPAPEGCCLDLPETLVILVALIIVVQLALKLATVICCYLCHFLGTLCGSTFAKEPQKPPAAPSKVKKAYHQRSSIQWSDQDVPRRRRRESHTRHRHCLHCTLEPVKVTMNTCEHAQNEHLVCREHQRAGRRPCPDHAPCHPPHCPNCVCENRQRQRTASAPSAYAVTRCRNVACGTSDPMLAPSGKERRSHMAVGLDQYPRTQAGEAPYHQYPRTQAGEAPYHPLGAAQDVEYAGGTPRSRRPAKVYIYPVHPQTPPGSRSASPERPYRRRGGLGGNQEEPLEFETREQRRKSRDAEQQSAGVPPPPPGPPRFHDVATSVLQGMAGQPESPHGRQRHYWPNQPGTSDWVYRPMK